VRGEFWHPTNTFGPEIDVEKAIEVTPRQKEKGLGKFQSKDRRSAL
jgi:hypothetical protein